MIICFSIVFKKTARGQQTERSQQKESEKKKREESKMFREKGRIDIRK